MGEFESLVGVNFWTALFTLINMILTFAILAKFLFKPVKKMIDDRQREIDDQYAQADAAQREAQRLQAEYTDKLSTARQTGEQIVKEATVRAQDRTDQILRQANQEAEAILEKAQADIALEKKKAVNDAKNEISCLAMAIAGKVVGRELTAQDQTDLVDRFIEGLGDAL